MIGRWIRLYTVSILSALWFSILVNITINGSEYGLFGWGIFAVMFMVQIDHVMLAWSELSDAWPRKL